MANVQNQWSFNKEAAGNAAAQLVGRTMSAHLHLVRILRPSPTDRRLHAAINCSHYPELMCDECPNSVYTNICRFVERSHYYLVCILFVTDTLVSE